MIWNSRLQSLDVELQDGLEVKVQGYPDVWSGNGMLTFKADAVIPIGEGAFRVAFERLKPELEKEGYFHKERNRHFRRHTPAPFYSIARSRVARRRKSPTADIAVAPHRIEAYISANNAGTELNSP